MTPSNIFGLAGLVLVVALAATAIQPGTTTNAVLDSMFGGFAKVVATATHQKTQ